MGSLKVTYFFSAQFTFFYDPGEVDIESIFEKGYDVIKTTTTDDDYDNYNNNYSN